MGHGELSVSFRFHPALVVVVVVGAHDYAGDHSIRGVPFAIPTPPIASLLVGQRAEPAEVLACESRETLYPFPQRSYFRCSRKANGSIAGKYGTAQEYAGNFH